MELAKLQQHRSWFISAASAAIIGLWLLSGQVFNDATEAEQESTARTKERPRSSVRVRTQNAEEIQRTIVVNGQTAPSRIVQLAAETDGRVEFIGADRGSNVNRGSVVVRLDARDRHARLAQAQATLKQREVEFDAREKLKTSSYVSEAQLHEALAALEAAKTEVTRAELDLKYMTIRAPFNGALQARIVEQGDFVKLGDPIATFVDNRTMIVSANLSEFDAHYVQIDDQAEARLATGETVYGQIRYVAPVADESTRTFLVELEIDNSDGTLRAGGTAELRIPAETVLAHRMSPALLTLDDAGNVGIKIINTDGAVEFVAADIALSTSEGVWIAGLPKSATIITVGQGFVPSGAIVNAVPESDVDTAVAIQSNGD
ncbi:MAG: efflux RND transporter periplasmic adaptor subunit [Gammaproteobacteria bacterium]|nr:efflux RND transporter periplasmic adaptor subunit [Gammaproteobacteria bacterium]